MDYHNIAHFFGSSIWGIMPEKMDAMLDFINIKLSGGDSVEMEAKKATSFRVSKGNIAVIPLYGIVSQRMNMLTQVSGGTSTEVFGGYFDNLMADNSVSAIVIDVDSPGGNVFGVSELADKIYASRGQKPVIAVANSLMASAAYWIASAADEIVITPGGEVGSIGVMAVHKDMSEAAAKDGVKHTIIRAGKYKAEGNPYEPIGDEAKDFIQQQVDSRYDDFVGAVARYRGVTVQHVNQHFGQGRVFDAAMAVDAGMVDRVGTLQQVLIDIRPNPRKLNNRKAILNERIRR
ncbi:MAG: signal peptide peptidase SppA [Planctomycetota bacterium]|nr:MAG: hypothetical protein B6244_14115 [Candidatus Cloacimonetes bacterium 4572_55]RKY07245.1 MAG: signal peptide peptidase SppA [Planctomycetota bacterium]